MSAYLSPCRTWRYSLTRDVAPLDGQGTVTFVMLNPSTADENVDDRTIIRCKGFARRWGFAQLKVVNAYALRATDPAALWLADDPVGPENDCTIAKVVGGSDLVVCAWGANIERERERAVLALISDPHCLKVTKDGHPGHPLYLRDDTLPQPFAAARAVERELT